MPSPTLTGQTSTLGSGCTEPRMAPNPVEISDDQASCHYRLAPELAKLVLSSVPTPGLLTQDAVRAFKPLSQSFANQVVNRIGQDSFIPTPTIGIPVLASRFSLSTDHQLPQQVIRVFPNPGSQNQPTALS